MPDSEAHGRKELKLNPNDFQLNEQGQLVIDKEAISKAMEGTGVDTQTSEAEAIKVTVTVEF
jgi:hypothetical protein